MPGCAPFPLISAEISDFPPYFPSSYSPWFHFSSWFVHSLQDRQLGMPYVGKVTEAVTKALMLQSEWIL